MPTYDYVCDACEHRFEHFQSMSSNRLRTCPKCKKRKLRRLIGSGAGVIFKGSGFYETDYKRKASGGPQRPAEKDASTESGGEGKTKDAASAASATKSPGAAQKDD